MKHLLTLTLLIALPAWGSIHEDLALLARVKDMPEPTGTVLVSDGFEEADSGGALGSATDGYDSDAVSDELAPAGTIDPDSTAWADVLDTEHLAVTGTAATDTGVVYDLGQEYNKVILEYRWGHSGVAPSNEWIELRNASDTVVTAIGWDSGYDVRFESRTTAWEVDTTDISGKYQRVVYDSGSTCEIALSPTTTYPTSGSEYASGDLSSSGGIRYVVVGLMLDTGTTYFDGLTITVFD
jgi:hypothetical protein